MIRLIIKISLILILLLAVIYNGFSQDWNYSNWLNNLITPLIIQPLILYLLVSVYLNRFDILNDEKSRINLSDSDLLEKYSDEEFISHNGKTYPAVIVYENKSMKNFKVQCTLIPLKYELPKILQPHIGSLLTLDKKIFNSITLRVEDIKEVEGTLNIKFSFSDYISYSITNNCADIKIDNFTIRDHLEPGPKLLPLKNSSAENHLGLSVLVFTKDNYLIVANRSGKVSSNRDTLAPSISGGVNYCNTYIKKSNTHCLHQMIKNEKNEELIGLDQDELIIEKTICLGMTRELRRMGKPEIFFKSYLDLSKNEVHKKLKTNSENKNFDFYTVNNFDKLLKNKKTSAPLRDALILYLNNKNHL